MWLVPPLLPFCPGRWVSCGFRWRGFLAAACAPFLSLCAPSGRPGVRPRAFPQRPSCGLRLSRCAAVCCVRGGAGRRSGCIGPSSASAPGGASACYRCWWAAGSRAGAAARSGCCGVLWRPAWSLPSPPPSCSILGPGWAWLSVLASPLLSLFYSASLFSPWPRSCPHCVAGVKGSVRCLLPPTPVARAAGPPGPRRAPPRAPLPPVCARPLRLCAPPLPLACWPPPGLRLPLAICPAGSLPPQLCVVALLPVPPAVPAWRGHLTSRLLVHLLADAWGALGRHSGLSATGLPYASASLSSRSRLLWPPSPSLPALAAAPPHTGRGVHSARVAVSPPPGWSWALFPWPDRPSILPLPRCCLRASGLWWPGRSRLSAGSWLATVGLFRAGLPCVPLWLLTLLPPLPGCCAAVFVPGRFCLNCRAPAPGFLPWPAFLVPSRSPEWFAALHVWRPSAVRPGFCTGAWSDVMALLASASAERPLSRGWLLRRSVLADSAAPAPLFSAPGAAVLFPLCRVAAPLTVRCLRSVAGLWARRAVLRLVGVAFRGGGGGGGGGGGLGFGAAVCALRFAPLLHWCCWRAVPCPRPTSCRFWAPRGLCCRLTPAPARRARCLLGPPFSAWLLLSLFARSLPALAPSAPLFRCLDTGCASGHALLCRPGPVSLLLWNGYLAQVLLRLGVGLVFGLSCTRRWLALASPLPPRWPFVAPLLHPPPAFSFLFPCLSGWVRLPSMLIVLGRARDGALPRAVGCGFRACSSRRTRWGPCSGMLAAGVAPACRLIRSSSGLVLAGFCFSAAACSRWGCSRLFLVAALLAWTVLCLRGFGIPLCWLIPRRCFAAALTGLPLHPLGGDRCAAIAFCLPVRSSGGTLFRPSVARLLLASVPRVLRRLRLRVAADSLRPCWWLAAAKSPFLALGSPSGVRPGRFLLVEPLRAAAGRCGIVFPRSSSFALLLRALFLRARLPRAAFGRLFGLGLPPRRWRSPLAPTGLLLPRRGFPAALRRLPSRLAIAPALFRRRPFCCLLAPFGALARALCGSAALLFGLGGLSLPFLVRRSLGGLPLASMRCVRHGGATPWRLRGLWGPLLALPSPPARHAPGPVSFWRRHCVFRRRSPCSLSSLQASRAGLGGPVGGLRRALRPPAFASACVLAGCSTRQLLASAPGARPPWAWSGLRVGVAAASFPFAAVPAALCGPPPSAGAVLARPRWGL